MNEFEYTLKVEALSKLKTKADKIKVMREFNLYSTTYTVWDLNYAIYMVNNFEGLTGWSTQSKILSVILGKVPNKILINLHPINKPRSYTKTFLNKIISDIHTPPYFKLQILKHLHDNT